MEPQQNWGHSWSTMDCSFGFTAVPTHLISALLGILGWQVDWLVEGYGCSSYVCERGWAHCTYVYSMSSLPSSLCFLCTTLIWLWFCWLVSMVTIPIIPAFPVLSCCSPLHLEKWFSSSSNSLSVCLSAWLCHRKHACLTALAPLMKGCRQSCGPVLNCRRQSTFPQTKNRTIESRISDSLLRSPASMLKTWC